VRRLQVAASVVPSAPILVTLMKEALGSSEMSLLTGTTWRKGVTTAPFVEVCSYLQIKQSPISSVPVTKLLEHICIIHYPLLLSILYGQV
jgi:hypothetical protein